MKITDNATLTTFLLGHPIQICVADDSGVPLYDIEFNIPTIYQVHCDIKIQTILGILKTKIEKLQEQFKNQIVNFTHYSFFTTVRIFKNGLSCYANYLEYTFQQLGLDFRCATEGMFIGEHKIDEQIFNYLRYTLLYATKLKDKKASLWEQDEAYNAAQERIEKIKAQKNNTNADKNFAQNHIILLYEFGLSPSEIQKLNVYQYENILKYTGKSINYKVSLIAAGNGNTKKVKFITKGD